MKGQLLFILLLLFSSAYAVNLRNNGAQQVIDNGDSVENAEIPPEIYEISPRFPGGDKAMLDFIKRNMCYPKCAKEKGIEGRVVVVSYYVETDGSLTDFSIVKSVDSRLDKEALRIIRKMPKWEPGQLGGKTVRMKYCVPVIFRCKDSTNDSTMVSSTDESFFILS